jgi:predicted RND superfamily exporter protein
MLRLLAKVYFGVFTVVLAVGCIVAMVALTWHTIQTGLWPMMVAFWATLLWGASVMYLERVDAR